IRVVEGRQRQRHGGLQWLHRRSGEAPTGRIAGVPHDPALGVGERDVSEMDRFLEARTYDADERDRHAGPKLTRGHGMVGYGATALQPGQDLRRIEPVAALEFGLKPVVDAKDR